MRTVLIFLVLCSLLTLGRSCGVSKPAKPSSVHMDRIEMNLSAFGVESAGFPNIRALIDLRNDTSYCDVSYYEPRYKERVYRLKKEEMDSVRLLISEFDIRDLQTKYSIPETDQPTSTVVFYMSGEHATQVMVSDYGLEGPSPLRELYRLVYKLGVNFSP